jgi:hypothetical protein
MEGGGTGQLIDTVGVLWDGYSEARNASRIEDVFLISFGGEALRSGKRIDAAITVVISLECSKVAFTSSKAFACHVGISSETPSSLCSNTKCHPHIPYPQSINARAKSQQIIKLATSTTSLPSTLLLLNNNPPPTPPSPRSPLSSSPPSTCPPTHQMRSSSPVSSLPNSAAPSLPSQPPPS